MASNVAIDKWAERLAVRLLEGTGSRWSHVEGVVRLARKVGGVLEPSERPYLVALAYVHDIGYAPELAVTGVHQLDGARYLKSLGADRLARLVAHHSEARFELRLRGVEAELSEYEREDSALSNAFTYCDLTTGPTGARVTAEERLAEVEARYREGLVVHALRLAAPHLLAAVERVEEQLRRLRRQAMTGLG